MNNLFSRFLFVSFIIIIAFVNFIHCSNTQLKPIPREKIQTYPADSLNSLLFSELQKRRVVMLGDNKHHHIYYMQKLLDFLSYWQEKSIRDTTKAPRTAKLVLILESLESDDSYKDALATYIKTDSLDSYMKFLLENSIIGGQSDKFSTDEVRFATGLRNECMKIDSINKSNKSSIDLVITGAQYQVANDLLNSKDINKTREQIIEGHEWFYNTRDKLIGESVRQLLLKYKDYKAVFFYGTAHLQRPKVNKNIFHWNNNRKAMGYFLAHYLDEQFGRSSVAVFDVKNSTVEGSFVEKFPELKDYPDYRLFDSPQPSQCFPLSLLKSKRLVNVFEALLKKFETDTTHRGHYLYAEIKKRYASYLFRTCAAQKIIPKETVTSVSSGISLGADDPVEQVLLHRDSILAHFTPIDCDTNFSHLCGVKGTFDDCLFFPMVSNVLDNVLTDYEMAQLNVNKIVKSQSRRLCTFSEARDKSLILHNAVIINYVMSQTLWIAEENERPEIINFMNKITGYEKTKSPK